MTFTGSILYHIAETLGVQHIKHIAKQADVINVLRITAYYPKREVRHSIATITERNRDRREMQIVYEGFNNHQPVKLSVERDDLNRVFDTLLQTRFDKLYDQPDVSYNDHSLWLIQRASGIFTHGIIVSPDKPQLPYTSIVNAIDDFLPEAIREVPLT